MESSEAETQITIREQTAEFPVTYISYLVHKNEKPYNKDDERGMGLKTSAKNTCTEQRIVGSPQVFKKHIIVSFKAWEKCPRK